MSHISKQKRQKWDPKSEKLTFIGYCENTKGYRLIQPITKVMTIARDVVLLEKQTKEKNQITKSGQFVNILDEPEQPKEEEDEDPNDDVESVNENTSTNDEDESTN